MEEIELRMKIGSFGRSKNYSPKLKFCMLEIEDQTNLKA